MRRIPPLAAAALLFVTARAAAHQSSLAYSEVVVDGRTVDYTVQISSADLFEAVGVDRDRPVTREEVRAGERRLLDYVASRVHLEARGVECPAEPRGVGFVDKRAGFFAAARLRYECPRTIEEATLRYDLFFDLDPRHQGLVRVAFGEGEGREQVLRADTRRVELRRDLGVWDHARDYLRLGVEHIFTGYDHIAFVFGLLVIAGAAGVRRGGRRILGVVTAFTLAHSVTLIASALGWVALPSRLVEPAIAVSIAWVGIENLVHRAPRYRWALTFGFGLIHGFGFASVLREIGLPSKGLLVSLVSFNVGVELGQLAVVAAVLPLLGLIVRGGGVALWEYGAAALGLCATYVVLRAFDASPAQLAVVVFAGGPLALALGRRWGYDRVVRLGGSALIAALALFWLVERVLDRSLLGGALG